MQTIPTVDGELYVRDGVIIGRKVIRGKVTTYYKGMGGVIHREDGPAIIDGQNHQTIYARDGNWDRVDGPAQIIKWPAGNERRRTWARAGKLHRDDGSPADIEYHENGAIKSMFYYVNNNLHRENLPAFIEYYSNGKTKSERWYQNGKYHRVGGPAVIEYDKAGRIINSEFYRNGVIITEDDRPKINVNETAQLQCVTPVTQTTQFENINARLDVIEANIQKIMAALQGKFENVSV